MNFTSKAKLGFVAYGILTMAAATALIGWASPLLLAPAPIVTMRDTFAKQDSIRTSDHLQINHRGVALTQSPDLRANRAEYYQPIAWYNSKHWWKKQAEEATKPSAAFSRVGDRVSLMPSSCWTEKQPDWTGSRRQSSSRPPSAWRA
jgi:hypothetical protein